MLLINKNDVIDLGNLLKYCTWDELIRVIPSIDTNDFSRRAMSQCLTEDYCRGWNDCYDAIMKRLEELK